MNNMKTEVTNDTNYHTPVLVREVVDCLGLHEYQTAVDCTLGGGGHTWEIARQIKGGKLICIDKDISAISRFRSNRLKAVNGETWVDVQLVHDDFCNLNEILDNLKIDKVDAILADLGVSSHQIDTAERGFSYMQDAELDMRMNISQDKTASHVVNNYRPERLAEVIRDYGEERYFKQITKAIVAARPISTTLQLAEIIKGAVPGSYFKTGGHPAKRTFQAIRIEVNAELTGLEKFIKTAVNRLNPNGRIAIISFHSLEDRIVKQTFAILSKDCICPPRTPICICKHKSTVEVLTKKPITATQDELDVNPRSSSAKLRAAMKK
jgi:16S rRNA (cytosine1402-N4)-methyltransferase